MTLLVVWSLGFAVYGYITWTQVEQALGYKPAAFALALLLSMLWPLFILVGIILGARKDSSHE